MFTCAELIASIFFWLPAKNEKIYSGCHYGDEGWKKLANSQYAELKCNGRRPIPSE